MPFESSAVAVMVRSGKEVSPLAPKLIYLPVVLGDVMLTLGEVLLSEYFLQKFQISLPVYTFVSLVIQCPLPAS